jgi:hypothetical protein
MFLKRVDIMKINILRNRKLAAVMFVSACILGGLLPLQIKADVIEDITAALAEAGADAESIAAITLQQVQSEVNNVLAEKEKWDKAAFQDVLRIAEQASVQVDALIPTIQGCIKEKDGTPLINAAVIEVGYIPGVAGNQYPLVATTSGEGVPATVFGIPVSESWLSEKQKRNWGAGCYWLPVIPGLIDGALSLVFQDSVISHRIIPAMQGYKMNPPGKLVIMKDGGDVIISNLDLVFTGGLRSGQTRSEAD